MSRRVTLLPLLDRPPSGRGNLSYIVSITMWESRVGLGRIRDFVSMRRGR